MQITPNFKLQEFQTRSPIPQRLLPNIKLVAEQLEKVRPILGAIRITSGYRDYQHNKDVGGSPSSYHLQGLAADFVTGNSPLLVGMVLTFSMLLGQIKPGELIIYKDFVHYAPAGKLDIQWR